MNPTFLKYLKHYTWGLVASTFNGGITGIVALGVLEEQSKLPEGITAHVLAHTFLVSCGMHALFYFQKHPLPEQLPDTPQQLNPPAVAAPNGPSTA